MDRSNSAIGRVEGLRLRSLEDVPEPYLSKLKTRIQEAELLDGQR